MLPLSCPRQEDPSRNIDDLSKQVQNLVRYPVPRYLRVGTTHLTLSAVDSECYDTESGYLLRSRPD